MSDDVFKVGTDATLLGALVDIIKPNGKVLDIGVGTGVLSLMLAQRYYNILIDAIDINKEAVILAKHNFNVSPFAERLSCSLAKAGTYRSNKRYDVIVSNPPYHYGGTISMNANIASAKHSFSLPIEDIIQAIDSNLKDDGDFWVIAPPAYIDVLSTHLRHHSWTPSTMYAIRHLKESKVSRQVVCYNRSDKAFNKSFINLYKYDREFSEEAATLLKDFLTVL